MTNGLRNCHSERKRGIFLDLVPSSAPKNQTLPKLLRTAPSSGPFQLLAPGEAAVAHAAHSIREPDAEDGFGEHTVGKRGIGEHSTELSITEIFLDHATCAQAPGFSYVTRQIRRLDVIE